MGRFIPSFEAMHREHQAWSTDHAQSEIDVRNWTEQLSRGISELESVQRELRSHERSLASHGNEILRHEAEVARHECSLAFSSKWSAECDCEEVVRQHVLLGEKHVREREVHERLKGHHYRIVAEIARLTAAVRTS